MMHDKVSGLEETFDIIKGLRFNLTFNLGFSHCLRCRTLTEKSRYLHQ